MSIQPPRGLFVVLLLLPVAGQAPDKPRFDAYHVVPHGSHGSRTLTTGQFASVLGWHLTPEHWCDVPHTAERPFPLTLCGVQVLVGGQAAGLLYAGAAGNADQINFQVPADVNAEGEVPIQVCVVNTCSADVIVPFTNKDILLRVQTKAFVHMPLWVDFTIPFNDSFNYPASRCPWDFGGFQIDVRKNGQVLPSGSMPKCTDANPMGTLQVGPSAISVRRDTPQRRLPVHLFHIFDTPGVYELRMSGPLLTPDLSKVSRIGYSDWIQVTVEPFSATERQAWLDTLERGDNPRDESQLIVSLLAQSDEKALKALLNFLPSPPPTNASPVSRERNISMNWTRDCLAPAALAAFPEALLKKVIPSAQLVNVRWLPRYCYWQAF